MKTTSRFPPYTINMVGENDAEINLYGEVVEQHPTDWWTGEKVPGNFIALDDFLHDLDELKTKDTVTVHINSVGGSLYAGLAIYNRLKALPGNVITINDALAASAGSIIFQAGNTRKVNAGSNLMIHEAASFLFGYYQVKDLKDCIKMLDAHNKTAVAAYAERTGKDGESIKTMLAKEMWMTGQEAVDNGFADEVIDAGGDVTMSVSPDKRFIVSNGVAMSTRGMGVLPNGVQTMTAAQAAAYLPAVPEENSVSPAPQVDIDPNPKNKTGGKENMDIKNMDDLRAAFPDFVSEIEKSARNAGHSDGVTAERARIQGIEAIENAIGDKEMVKNAKYGEKPLTAEQLAFQAMQAQAAIGATVLNKLEGEAANSGAANVVATPAETGEGDPEAEAIAMIASSNPKKKKEG